MAINNDREELIRLRVALARIAQACDLDHEIPGVKPTEWGDAPYEELVAHAANVERGWHRLAAGIVSWVFARKERTDA